MPEIASVGTVDYQNPYQVPEEPQQLPVDAQQPNGMGEIPVAYDPEMAEKSKSASSMSGATILGSLALATIALFGGRKWGQKGAKDAIKELNELKNSDAIKNFEKVQQELNEIKESMAAKNYEKIKEALDKITEMTEKEKTHWYNPWSWGKSKVAKKIKEVLSPLNKDVEKAADEAKKAADDAADGASK